MKNPKHVLALALLACGTFAGPSAFADRPHYDEAHMKGQMKKMIACDPSGQLAAKFMLNIFSMILNDNGNGNGNHAGKQEIEQAGKVYAKSESCADFEKSNLAFMAVNKKFFGTDIEARLKTEEGRKEIAAAGAALVEELKNEE